MNEKLNLVEILKDAPKGTKLWSPICGECEFLEILEERLSPIKCKALEDKSYWLFRSDGSYAIYEDAECLLFPSKDNRDWSTFKAPWKHKHFEPFQKVLVKIWHNSKSTWIADFYSHWDEVIDRHYFASGLARKDDDVIPYDGNEDKLGRTVK
jgi:hypothetical protein